MQTIQNTFQELLSADNGIRQRAEAKIKDEFEKDPKSLASQLTQGLSQSSSQDQAMYACALLKKYFLDATSKSSLTPSDLEILKQAILASIDFPSEPLVLLKRKCDLLSKIFSKLEQNTHFVQYLVPLCDSADVKSRQFALYAFEILSEMHLSAEELTNSRT